MDLHLTLYSLWGLFCSEVGFPLLENLAIGHRETQPGRHHEQISLFGAAPRLQSVHIRLDMNGDIQLPDVAFPWSQLTNATGTSFTGSEAVELLQHTPALVNCVMHLSGSNVGITSLPSPHPSLKTLQLLSSSCDQQAIYDALTLPGLEDLTIANPPHVSITSFDPLALLLTRSSCTLRTFSCTMISDASLESFFICLKLMPNLSTLELSSQPAHMSGALIQQLSTNPDLVLHLETLSLRCPWTVGQFSLSAWLHFLQARRSPDYPVPIKNVELMWGWQPPYPDAEALLPFQELVRDGLDLYLGGEDLSWL
jgi:hypothetical protein